MLPLDDYRKYPSVMMHDPWSLVAHNQELATTQAPKSTIPLLKVLRIYSFQQCQDLHYCQDLRRDQGIAARRDLHSWDEAVNYIWDNLEVKELQ